ncbi:YwqG family protein [Mycoplasmatota bacterium WC30]
MGLKNFIEKLKNNKKKNLFVEQYINLIVRNEEQLKLVKDLRKEPNLFGFKIVISIKYNSDFNNNIQSKLSEKGRNSKYDMVLISHIINNQLIQTKILSIVKYNFLGSNKSVKEKSFQYLAPMSEIDKLPQVLKIVDDFLDSLPNQIAIEAIRLEDEKNEKIEARKNYVIDESIPEDFIEIFKKSKLEYLINEAYKATKNKISLEADPFYEKDIGIGSTKLGGMPDLPHIDIWPEENGVKLSFLLQVNIQDVKKFDKNSYLPVEGLLLFFYDNINQPWKSNGKGIKVLHIKNEDLRRMSKPSNIDEIDVFKEVAVKIKSKYSIPITDDLYFFTDEEENNYFRIVEGNPEQETYLLGNPIEIQSDILEENKHVFPKETENIDDWILLLQVDSEYEAKMLWGDAGKLYFLINKNDLAQEEFSKIRLLLQCY